MFRRKDPFRSSLPPLPTELVTVFRASDPSTIMIAESILRSAQVDFLTLGGDAEHPWSSPAGIPVFGRQIEFQVRREDSQDAVSLLADLQAQVDAGDSLSAWDESDEAGDA
ncbi:MAG: hypothetical protein Q7W51_07895 [Coriobacteriia bacterium]|nr:hypothetical protein [Coriobacteriia bacterium]